VERRIHELGLDGAFVLKGQQTQLKRAYLEAEIFCHPAMFEGFGLAVAEALACGLPVVGFSGSAGVCELVRDGENGLIAEQSGGALALAAALERLIVDEPLRLALRARAPESTRTYTQDAFRRRWAELLEEVVP
jgi:glycosyltransferase involved in cell wall biosynthesis